MGGGHYGDLTPINASHGDRQKHRARKMSRVMLINQLDYERLKGFMLDRVGQPKLATTASSANTISALCEFLRERKIEPTDIIGETLRDHFYKERDEHLEAQRALCRTRDYVKNRRTLLNRWHCLIRALDHEGAEVDGVPTPLQVRMREFMRGRTFNGVAVKLGMAGKTLASWCNGRQPRPGSEIQLTRIEEEGDMMPGTLTDLLPYNAHRHENSTANGPVIPYRVRLGRLTKDRYLLHPLLAPPLLRAHWCRLFVFKMSSSEPVPSLKMSAGDRLRAIRKRAPVELKVTKKQWRLEPLDRSTIVNADVRWVDVFNGQQCASAATTYKYVAAFLGWAMISLERGGRDLKLEDLSLGLFTDAELLAAHLEWRIDRSETINNGHTNFLGFVASLLRPETGFLVTKGGIEVGASCGFSETDWLAKCAATHEWVTDEKARLYDLGVVRARDPGEPLRFTLDMAIPLENITAAVRRLELCQPSKTNRASHGRDLFMLSLTCSNPLRAKQLMGLTYLPDNSGQLYQNSLGEWRIRIPKFEFKNFKGAAKHKDYDQAVDPSVWPYLRRYLTEWRPMLGGDRPEILFVSAENPNRPWAGLDQQFFKLTKKYVANSPGFGPHSMRHVVASTIIMQAGGTKESVVVAASALHDMPDTVRESYAILLDSHGDRGRKAALGKHLEGLARRQPVVEPQAM